MKFLTLLAAFAMAVASTDAAECTTDKIEAVQSKPEFKKAQTACEAAQSLTSSASEEAAKKICKESDCLNSLQAALAVLPDCTVQGANLKDTYQQLYKVVQDGCKELGVSVDSTPSSSTTTAPVASGASTSALSAAAAVAAVVVLAQQ